MSKCTDIKEICGDYTFDVKYSEDNRFTMFFNSLRNAETVKRCIEADDSVPNVATAVDFVEVVRCKDCVSGTADIILERIYHCERCHIPHYEDFFCSYGKRKGD